MIRDLLRDGLSLSAIARRTGVDRKTIRKLRDQPAQPTPRSRQPRPGVLDPYKPYLEQRLARGVLNASKLHAELRQQGYAGGIAVVRRYVAPRRPQTPVLIERFETLPGQQAQVDWAHCGQLADGGRRRALSAFVLTLGYSRRQYVEFTLSQDLTSFLRCHVHAFDYFGGLPHELLYDNLKTAVDHRTSEGTVIWNPHFRDFIDYYGLIPRACRPYRAQTKGKVERGIRYVRGNFLLGLDLDDQTVASLNRDVLVWLRETADVRIHGTTRERPLDRWPAELAALLPLTAQPAYDTRRVTPARVTREGRLRYAGLQLDVPPEHAGHLVLVKEDETQRVQIYLGERCLCEHRLDAAEDGRLRLPGQTAAVRALTRRRPAAAPLPAVPPSLPDWPAVERRPLAAYDELVGVAG